MSIKESLYLGQPGVWISNESTRLFVQSFGGMTPEFSALLNGEPNQNIASNTWVNTHWNPHFKATSSGWLDHSEPEQVNYWGIELLRQAAGTFPCAPTFGPGNNDLLPHGDCANSQWQLKGCKTLTFETRNKEETASLAHWTLNGTYKQLKYQKWDYLHQSQSAHYSVLEVSNPTGEAVDINLAWHTTLGAPFLEQGCLIFNNGDEFKVAPSGTEFDTTTQLVPNRDFSNFSQAPTQAGGAKDLHKMDGYTGYSDFVSATSDDDDLLWSLCVNPRLNLVYLSLIPLSALPNQVNAQSMNYWNHCGGRDFTPWADFQGGVDRTYALGMEASIGSSCQGLDHSREHRVFMNKPCCYSLPPQHSITFPCINTLFALTADELATIESGKSDPQQLKSTIEAAVLQHIAALDLEFTAVAVANNN
jgi:hypothetical protein